MSVKPVTQHLIDAVMLDMWPKASACCDFGINTQEEYNAYFYAIRRSEVTPEQLDTALGDGPKLTELLNNCPENKLRGNVVKITTPYDGM